MVRSLCQGSFSSSVALRQSLSFLSRETLMNSIFFSRAIGKAYKITSIPTFLLIGPDGGIIFSGHDSNDLDAQLEKL